MSSESKYVYHVMGLECWCYMSIYQYDMTLSDIDNYWNVACYLYGHAATAVNKQNGRCPWHAFELLMATANTTPAPAGTSLTVPLPLTKWVDQSAPDITSTTSTVSKLTTVTQTSPLFRHLPMPKFTTNHKLQKQTSGRITPAAI